MVTYVPASLAGLPPYSYVVGSLQRLERTVHHVSATDEGDQGCTHQQHPQHPPRAGQHGQGLGQDEEGVAVQAAGRNGVRRGVGEPARAGQRVVQMVRVWGRSTPMRLQASPSVQAVRAARAALDTVSIPDSQLHRVHLHPGCMASQLGHGVRGHAHRLPSARVQQSPRRPQRAMGKGHGARARLGARGVHGRRLKHLEGCHGRRARAATARCNDNV